VIILEHSRYDERSIASNMGEPEYSYWFVRKAFRPLLSRIGRLVSVANPEQEADGHYRRARETGEPCLLLTFNPPHYLPRDLQCPAIPVFAWEFDGLPDENWGNNPFNDWRIALAHAGRAVTHSTMVVGAVRDALGDDFPIWSIPAPVFDRAGAHRGSARGETRASIPLDDAFAIELGAIDTSLFHATRAADTKRALTLLDYRAALHDGPARHLDLDGVVYTSVFNPSDGRKNWTDMMAAFVVAFRDVSRAILVLKVSHASMVDAVQPMLAHLANLGSFKCRIVLVYGLLSDEGYARLVAATSYAVNTSMGEGQCLPLMEFMSAGRPAIAPMHSAMLDYVNAENAFVVPTTIRPGHWPHDERHATRCYKHVVRFEGLVEQFRASYRLALGDPEGYARMSEAAIAAQEAYCSDRVAMERLQELFAHSGRPSPANSDTAETEPGGISMATSDRTINVEDPLLDGYPISDREEPYSTGVYDARLSGWYNEPAGELARGFPITPESIVVDVGCGDGGPVTFAARIGARVTLIDIEADRVERTAQTLRDTTPAVIDYHISDSAPLPLPDGYADRIICMEVLEHVADPRVVMDELVRIGKPGALYLLSVPGALSEHFQKQLAPPNYFEPPNHIRIFENGQLRALVEAAGLDPIVVDGYGFFWSFLMAIFWQTEVDLGKSHRSFETFSSLWKQVLAGKDGSRIKRAFDDVMPRVQYIVARKPV
jgi:2-polyprenyl-3-methyl-5-hydroxy-6-metoxy-1,4-benzoquinol methylase/glycosyltransferase involved in cell wall biosynthesis